MGELSAFPLVVLLYCCVIGSCGVHWGGQHACIRGVWKMGSLNAYYIPVYCCVTAFEIWHQISYALNLMSQLPHQILYIDSCLCAGWLHDRYFCHWGAQLVSWGVTSQCMQWLVSSLWWTLLSLFRLLGHQLATCSWEWLLCHYWRPSLYWTGCEWGWDSHHLPPSTVCVTYWSRHFTSNCKYCLCFVNSCVTYSALCSRSLESSILHTCVRMYLLVCYLANVLGLLLVYIR